MGMDYFREALSSIKLVQELDTGLRVQLHVRQCQYLSFKMSDTGNFLKGKSNSPVGITSGDDVRRTALRQLHFTVKRAETLVRGCCCEVEPSWLESAVTFPQIKEDIVHILLDLCWWISMVDIAIASVTSEEEVEQVLLEVAEKDFQKLLEEFKSPDNELDKAFVEDREQLLRGVREVLSSYSSKPRDLDYLLATHVRTRLENTNLFQSMAEVELNQHEFINLIGFGSFGAVMNVKWLGRSCALKSMRCKSAKEVPSLSAFHHPHIVQFFRYWEAHASNESPPHGSPVGSIAAVPSDAASTETDFLVELQILMELLPTDLAEHLLKLKLRAESRRNLSKSKVAAMSQDVAIDAMLQVTKAMMHLNDNNVAHRGLKPSNVLVMPVSKEEFPELAEGGYVRLKLTDFGEVKVRAMSPVNTTLTKKVGTRLYGAPEIFTNESISEKVKEFPRKADVWSFGIMFSELLSGQPPFRQHENGRVQLQAKIHKGLRPSLPPTCPDYLKFIITNCWQLRPQDRPSFTDLCKLLRIAQVRSLGLIRANYDFFTFTTSAGIEKRLHKPCAPVKNQVFSCLGVRVPSTKYKFPAREPRQPNFSRQQSKAGRSLERSQDKPLGYLVNAVGTQDPTPHHTKLDVIFFEGNVGRRQYLSCKDTWVQRGKPDVWWPRDWLPKDFNGDIRVLLLEYSISEKGVEGVVEDLQKLLVFSDRWNRGHTWDRPIVLVGHSLGCVVIEQLVVALNNRAESSGSLKDGFEANRAKVSKAFLASLAGCFFYSPPYTGLVRREDLLKYVFGGLTYSPTLFNDLCLPSPKLKELSERFMEARSESVKLMALVEGFHTRGRFVVPPAPIDDFKASGGRVEVLMDSNHSDTCKPTGKKHRAYWLLFEFIKEVLKERMVVGTLQLKGGEGSSKARCESSVRTFDKHESKVEAKDGRPQLFLSYSNEMRDIAMQLSMELKSSNYNVVDQDSISCGEVVDQCQLVIVIFLYMYVISSQSMSELRTIVKSKRTNNPTLKVYPLFYKLTLEDLQNVYDSTCTFATTFGGETLVEKRISLDGASGLEPLKFLLEGKNNVSKKVVDLVCNLRQGRVDVGKFL